MISPPCQKLQHRLLFQGMLTQIEKRQDVPTESNLFFKHLGMAVWITFHTPALTRTPNQAPIPGKRTRRNI